MARRCLTLVGVLIVMGALPTFAQDVQHVGGRLVTHAKTPIPINRNGVPEPRELPPAAHILYNSFGPTNTNLYDPNNGFLVTGTTNPQGQPAQSIAVNFYAPANEHVTEVSMPMQYWNLGDGAAKAVQVAVYNDVAGLPGAAISPVANKNTVGNFPSCCQVLNVKFGGGGVALNINLYYWVVVTPNPAGGTTEAVWNFTSLTYGYNANGAGWVAADATLPAMQVKGTIP